MPMIEVTDLSKTYDDRLAVRDLSFAVGAGEILFAIILFSIIYLILGILYVMLILNVIKKGTAVDAH